MGPGMERDIIYSSRCGGRVLRGDQDAVEGVDVGRVEASVVVPVPAVWTVLDTAGGRVRNQVNAPLLAILRPKSPLLGSHKSFRNKILMTPTAILHASRRLRSLHRLARPSPGNANAAHTAQRCPADPTTNSFTAPTPTTAPSNILRTSAPHPPRSS